MKFRYGALISVASVVLVYSAARAFQGETPLALTAVGMILVIASAILAARRDRNRTPRK